MSSTSKQVRDHLVDALRLDLVGPRPGYEAHQGYQEEILPISPASWYLAGFLVPSSLPSEERQDDDSDELFETDVEEKEKSEETPEVKAAGKAFFPSSMGLSVLVTAETRELRAKVLWGEYTPVTSGGLKATPEEAGESGSKEADKRPWQRRAQESEVTLALNEGTQASMDLPGTRGLQVAVSVREVRAPGIVPAGTKAASVFVVNHRPALGKKKEEAYIFQAEIQLSCKEGFVARPDTQGQESQDWDDKVADLQYRDAVEYAVGHNVAAFATRDEEGRCFEVRTEWLPQAHVEKVVPRTIEGMELGMEALADAPDAKTLQAQIAPMLRDYEAWLEDQGKGGWDGSRKDVAELLLRNGQRAKARIQAGLDALHDPLIRRAFGLANKAVAMALRQRAFHDKPGLPPEQVEPPGWRPFQIAFVLMNLLGIADKTSQERATVDLLFFPTGGGKTEAYLGLAAFTIFLRRLRDPSIRSAGVTILMRYTLRLLTLDQLGRAATLICAMEKLRQAGIEELGTWPIEIGLWVGQAATPNRMGRKGDKNPDTARQKTLDFQKNSKSNPSPIPLENCPWCGSKFTKDSFQLVPQADEPLDLRIVCSKRDCDFHGSKQQRGLPLLTVDEPIYRRLPAFLISTVDKFANLPWVGETGGLFGRVERHDNDGFYGPCTPNQGRTIKPLAPPDLIIQDELHLISGPLGTMVGLYETAIDALASQTIGEVVSRPKIIASTATVRRAERQIRGLFGRLGVEIFPPPGPDRRDSFFAQTVKADERNARMYLGIAAQGRSFKLVFLRTALTLMAAVQTSWQENKGARDPKNPADPYMTLVGYFNSLRELGGSRRIVEDEVFARLSDYGSQRKRLNEPRMLFADRPQKTEVRELTSRIKTHEVAETKRLLALPYKAQEHTDVVLATNMISVGLDITRLGLMLVLGQPKMTAEYIQATSRVGRDEERPGLVVTLLNLYRHRDRSHYERFSSWHESFYRAVEATSVTPFSPRALDRGLAGVTVALARLGHKGMTAPASAARVTAYRADLHTVAETIAQRAETHDPQLNAKEAEDLRKKVKARVEGLLDAWGHLAEKKGILQYQKEIGAAPPLLFDWLDPEVQDPWKKEREFRAGRSLRDVEGSVHLWLLNPDGKAEENEP